MLRISASPYVCQSCRQITLRPQLRPSLVGLRPTVSPSGKWLTTQPNEPNDQRFGKENIPSALIPSLERIAEMPVRQRLHYWAKENESKKPLSMPAEANLYGTMLNSMSRTQTTKAADMNNLRPGPTGSQTGSATEFSLEHDEHAIVGTDTSKPGDMVEIRNTGSRMPILAIYLGFFGDRNHFYAANGLWNTSRGFSSHFTVSNFVRPEELQPILSQLPETGTLEDFEKMKEEERGPSREDAKALINKMDDFRAQAEAVYQRNLAKLDGAHTLLSTSDQVRYLSLFQMADALLPKSILVDGEVPPAALYAVHTALTRNEFGFQPISSSRAIQRRDQLYEVFPKDQTGIIDKACVLVREYVTLLTKKARNASASKLDDTPLGKFIAQARTAVLNSRKFREITPYGILKPSNGGTVPKPTWLSTSKDFILFLEYWASYGLFESSSRLHSNGAMILRSLGVYDNVPLSPTTAWTFLQEIGHIMPWEVPSRYKVRFPGTEILPGAGLKRQEPSIKESKRKDIAAGVRQEVTAPVFCIDGSSTRVIDDGISVERTDNAKEFWVHVHAADPASGIKPNSELCKYMELIPDNIYLPGHFQAMLPTELGDKDGDYKSESLIKQYSLQKDCPSLTFSAKVNRQGEMLEYKVEPSTLRNVVYMEPEDLSRFCLEPRPQKRQSTEFTVGKKKATQGYKAERNVVLAKDLEKAEQEDVLLLHELTHAIGDRRLKNGAWPYFFPRPSVSIEFDTTKRNVAADEIAIPADPYIHVGTEPSTGCAVVSNSMVLAGEIAARWCADRQIAVPYRRDAMEGREHQAALAYAQSELYPLIGQGVEPSVSQRNDLARLTGGIEIAAQPGPYFLLGLDMYAKATSPLRRFGDLLVHWQIHSALAHERATGRTLDAAKGDNLDEVLAFSRTQLADTLPLLQLREKLGRAVGRGTSDWMRIALARAWQFDKTLPTVAPDGQGGPGMVFTVDVRLRDGLLGRLSLFGLEAIMDAEGLNKCMLMKDVRVEDEFDVELADVNVHTGQILVKALRCRAGAVNDGATTMVPSSPSPTLLRATGMKSSA